MSEYVQDEGDIEERVMNEMLASMDDQYVTYDPQPKHLNAIFEKLRNTQSYFATEFQYASSDVAIIAGQRFVNHINQYFKELGKNDKLLGETATLSGAGVLCPHMSINFSTGDATVSHSAPLDEEGEFDSQTMDVVGLFRGLGYMVRSNNDDESHLMTASNDDVEREESYYVRLYYQVETGVYQHPLGKTALYTLGEVGVSRLAFENDSEREAAYEALTQLLSNESLEIAELVNELNQVLTNPKHAAKQIRKIGNLVQQLHACDALRPEDSEAVLDLITTYIPPQAAYRIGASDVLEYQTKARETECSLVKATDGAPVEYEQYISNIILAPGYDSEINPEDPQTLKATGIVPYFVLEVEGSVIHASMQRVIAFGDAS